MANEEAIYWHTMQDVAQLKLDVEKVKLKSAYSELNYWAKMNESLLRQTGD